MGVFETQDAFLDDRLLAGAHLEPTPLFQAAHYIHSHLQDV